MTNKMMDYQAKDVLTCSILILVTFTLIHSSAAYIFIRIFLWGKHSKTIITAEKSLDLSILGFKNTRVQKCLTVNLPYWSPLGTSLKLFCTSAPMWEVTDVYQPPLSLHALHLPCSRDQTVQHQAQLRPAASDGPVCCTGGLAECLLHLEQAWQIICPATTQGDLFCFETDDGVNFSNLLSNRVENVIKIKAERRLTSTLTIVAVIFGLLTLNADQEGEAHRQNQLRGKM